MKNSYKWMLLLILSCGVTEIVSHSGLYLLKQLYHIEYEPVDQIQDRHAAAINTLLEGRSGYFSFSTPLGWTIKPNGQSRLYRANAAGIRGDREYAPEPPRGVLRISTYGDSFTHCDGVENRSAWQAIMEASGRDLEVINFGVSGYGLDQAYLRYLEGGRHYEPDIVLIGFMSENIYRNVNTFRPFYFPRTGLPLAKPRFAVADGALVRIPNPIDRLEAYQALLLHPQEMLSSIGVNDYYYRNRYRAGIFDWLATARLIRIFANVMRTRLSGNTIIVDDRYNENSEAFRVTRKIFEEFHAEVIRNNSLPIVLVFPNLDDITRYRKFKRKRYAPLLAYFEAEGFDYMDLMDVLDRAGSTFDIKELYRDHYTPLANRLVADYILEYLDTHNLEQSHRTRQAESGAAGKAGLYPLSRRPD